MMPSTRPGLNPHSNRPFSKREACENLATITCRSVSRLLGCGKHHATAQRKQWRLHDQQEQPAEPAGVPFRGIPRTSRAALHAPEAYREKLQNTFRTPEIEFERTVSMLQSRTDSNTFGSLALFSIRLVSFLTPPISTMNIVANVEPLLVSCASSPSFPARNPEITGAVID